MHTHVCSWCEKLYGHKNLDNMCSLKCREEMNAFIAGNDPVKDVTKKRDVNTPISEL